MIKTLGKKLFFILLIYFIGLFAYAGSVESSVDTTEVPRGDSVLFSITVVGEESDPLPEMEEIDGVKIDQITRNKSSDFVQVDGKNVMQHTTTVTYEFKPTYNMTIPAFQLMVDGKSEITEAINLKVVKAIKGSKRKNKYFSLDIKLNKSTAYLGEPVIATVYFRQNSKIKLMELDYKKPLFSNFFSKQLEGEKTYNEGADTVHELSYLLIPKKEGNIRVEPATAKVSQRVQERQAGGWFSNVPKWSSIASPSLTLEVKTPIGNYDIVGDFELNSSIDRVNVKANKAVNLTIELAGEGSLDEFLGIEFDLPNVTIYSEKAKVNSKWEEGKLMSYYVKHFVFVANDDFIIPSKTVRLFNYKTRKVKIIKTKAYDINVDGKDIVGASSIINTKESIVNEHCNKSSASINFSYWVLAAMFLLGSVMTPILQYLFTLYQSKWKQRKQGFNGHEALRVLYPNIGKSKEVEDMVRKLYAVKNGEKGVEIDHKLLKKMVNEYSPTI